MITRRVTIKYRSEKYRSELERPVSWVALVGFMGSGKSRIGAELSRKLHLNFIDTDRVIERVSCMRIPDIFELYGEATFRDYESEIVRRSCRLDDAIVSTGGGTVIRPQNRDALKQRGPVVLLTASAETTFQRTRRHKRPLLEVGNPIERINDLMAARKGFYEDVASFAVSTDGRPSFEVVDEIIEKLYDWEQEQQQLEMLQAAEQEQRTQQHPQEIPSQEIPSQEISAQEIPQYYTHQFTDLTQQVTHEEDRIISQTSVLRIETQQVFTENAGLSTNHLSDKQFSDQFLTESNESREAESLADDSITEVEDESYDFQSESTQPEQEAQSLEAQSLETMNTVNTTNTANTANTIDTIDTTSEISQMLDATGMNAAKPQENIEMTQNTEENSSSSVQEIPEETKSIDIYAEMIRDLMRDRRA